MKHKIRWTLEKTTQRLDTIQALVYLLPHTGSVGTQTISEEYALNQPLITDLTKGKITDSKTQLSSLEIVEPPIISCDQTNILIDTIKWTEDENGWIIRLYDSLANKSS